MEQEELLLFLHGQGTTIDVASVDCSEMFQKTREQIGNIGLDTSANRCSCGKYYTSTRSPTAQMPVPGSMHLLQVDQQLDRYFYESRNAQYFELI